MNPVLQTILISLIVGTLLALVGFALGRLGRSRDRKTDDALRLEAVAIEAVVARDRRIGELEKSVMQLEERAASRDKEAIPITAAMQAMLIHKLTNPHTPEADALLKKLSDETLTVDDAKEFAEAMEERQHDMEVSEAQRLAAKILPDMVRLRELAEVEAQEEGTEVKTVLVTVPKTETIAAKDGGTQEQEKGN